MLQLEVKCFGNSNFSLLLDGHFWMESDSCKCQAGKLITPCVVVCVWIFNNRQIATAPLIVYCKFNHNFFF